MQFIFILLLTTQVFSAYFCQTINGSSKEFTQENFLTVLSDFQKQLLSANITNGCNISLTIHFQGGRGLVDARCYNKSEYSGNDLRLDATIQFNQTGITYTSVLYDVCSSNKSWNPSFINEWISRQQEMINKIGNMEKKKNFIYIKFLIWGGLQSNKTDLSFAIFVNQNENRSATDDNRLPCRYTHQMIINRISWFIIQFSDLVIPSPFNDTTNVIEKMKEFFNDTRSSDSCSTPFVNPTTAMKKNQTIPEGRGTTPLMNSSKAMKKNQTKPKGRDTTPFMNLSKTTAINQKKNDKSLFPLFIVIIILVVLILIIVSVVCFILYYQRRSGYRLTAVS